MTQIEFPASEAEIETTKCVYCESYFFEPSLEGEVCFKCLPKAEADLIVDDILVSLQEAIKLREREGEDIFLHRKKELTLLSQGLNKITERDNEERKEDSH